MVRLLGQEHQDLCLNPVFTGQGLTLAARGTIKSRDDRKVLTN
jgi:hypothetical protein